MEPHSAIESAVQIVLPAVAGGVTGIVSAIAAMRLQHRARANEAIEKVQIQYLNPLLLAAADFRERLEDIDQRTSRNDKLLSDTINELKNVARTGSDYARWANGFGHFALSTLYVTSVYFACASKIRADLPFAKLSSGEDRMLLDLLGRIRQLLGGEFGIWENLQDSFGSYVRRSDGTMMNYREFCGLFDDPGICPWFLRMIDFYRDIDRKLAEERQLMIRALRALELFLNKR